MLYELVNPSDPYVFEADSFPVAVATAWLISPGSLKTRVWESRT